VPGQLLVAVDDSPIGLDTGSVAVQVASFLRARMLVLHVAAPAGAPESLLTGATRPAAGRGATRNGTASALALLEHIAALARLEGLEVATETTAGDPGHRILDRARRWPADVIVLGRSEREGDGPHHVGTQTKHVLRFALQPVLVVPRRDAAWLPGMRSTT
jgi:nucleotide-binding universal stress UspA family protein